ncbi:unnamed protein product [Ostreobium quekettii]|uniref:Acyl-[acyl-carrier-protein] desaturase n=1 Tax=Ostreobium quekettii TaxID=121088 RepID=A0A8S1JDW8_9CHLO|nr:unnamed protein product [Ostreobium quekettii]|eukprot:evm.model.scf_381.2 EVM.evm.TU.scf_381.2   scf_381:39039-43132(+)
MLTGKAHPGPGALAAPAMRRVAPVKRIPVRVAASGSVQAPPETPSKGSAEGPTIVDKQVLHSLTDTGREVIGSMDEFIRTDVTKMLRPVSKSWQPADFLPLPESSDFIDQVVELRTRVQCLPTEYLVVLVGDMITEEALPTYMAMLNTLEGVCDETGASLTPWAQWTRQWTAEENRHGDLLNKYLYLSGRVDLRKIETTIQNLIGTGMDPKTDNNPYLGFIYTSFQERATKISHGNTANHALEYGDDVLAKICGTIASDESRHEIAYTKIVDELFRLDPSGTMLAFADMMRKQIVMPAHWMNDNEHQDKNKRSLFADFSAVAERLKVYTAMDYADIMEHLIKRWNVGNIRGLSADAEAAQDYLCALPPRIRKISERAAGRRVRGKPVHASFSWVFDESVLLHGSSV